MKFILLVKYAEPYKGILYCRHYRECFGKLLGKLDESSVVVLDNAPYHNAQTDKYCNPTTSWKKGDIQTWISNHNINFDQKMLKPELLETAGCRKFLSVYQADALPASTNKDTKTSKSFGSLFVIAN